MPNRLRAHRAFVDALALSFVVVVGCAAPAHAPSGPPPVLEADLGRAAIHRGDTSARVVQGGAPDPHPELDPERAALDARQADLARCYETAIAQTPSANGRVVLEVWFSAAGEVQRTRVASADRPLEPARACLEQALRGATMESAAPAGGVHARRTYEFTNPATTLNVVDTLAITPGEPGEPPPPQRHTRPEGDDAGSLREIEIAGVVSGRLRELQVCYAATLQHAPTAEGSETFRLDVAADGTIAAAAVDDAPSPLDLANDCLVGVLRGLRFRATGTASTVHVPASFARRFWAPP